MFITLLWYCCTCNALRAATQVCHTTCSSSSFLTAATVSFTPLRSFLPTFRFITPCSQLCICFKAGHPFCPGTNQCTWNAPAFPQASPTILTGFHFAALRHTFTSVAFSPPAAHNLACLAACHGCGFVKVFVTLATDLIRTKTHAKPLRLTVAVYRRFTAF